MLSYSLKCSKNTESENPKVVKTINERMMLLSKGALWNSKKEKNNKDKKLVD